ncbi:MAG: Na/Pi cotransporter family protein [Oscillospiraceae bacterium]|nr:Na/Pi cotransporter family protein [Oscillospiraceae bacterium]
MSLFELFSLLGGVGLFLYGMTIMSTGLKNACGENLRVILEHATKNKVISVVVGIAITMLIQSSSATDVMVIGFVNSGLMSLTQAIGVIMGANIGTTITAQITAFNLSAYAPMILFVGAVMYLFVKKDMVKYIGSVIMGFGMLFEGIALMKAAIAPLAETEAFINMISALENPFLIVLFGVLFTALLQSSSSATVIFQAFAVQGIITYETSVFLVIGAAIGSVTPNILASLTMSRNGKRTALLNLMFNLIRAAILMTLILIFPQILTVIKSLSPDNVARQIANTHTIFAIFAVLVMLPFSDYIVKLTQKLLPLKPEESRSGEERKLMYMTQTGAIPSAVALSQAQREIARMGEIASRNLKTAIKCFFEQDDSLAELVEETEDTVNYLDRAIIAKLVELRTLEMTPRDLSRVYHMTLVVADIERLSDHAENIIEYEAQVHSGKATLSKDAMDELRNLADLSLQSVDLCLSIFAGDDYDRLQEAEDLEDLVDDTQETIIGNHVKRLMNATCDPMGGVVFTDMATDLERCSDHAINIATALSDHPS